jgi:NADH dehydrogenase FAD-containing subunit
LISRRIGDQSAPVLFRYFDKGKMAVKVSLSCKRQVQLSGFPAWLAWAGVHLQFLAQSSLRASVFVQWVWTYLTEGLPPDRKPPRRWTAVDDC